MVSQIRSDGIWKYKKVVKLWFRRSKHVEYGNLSLKLRGKYEFFSAYKRDIVKNKIKKIVYIYIVSWGPELV